VAGKLQSKKILNGVPLQENYIDYIGPKLDSRDCKYILVATCRAIKFCFARSLQKRGLRLFKDNIFIRINSNIWTTQSSKIGQ